MPLQWIINFNMGADEDIETDGYMILRGWNRALINAEGIRTAPIFNDNAGAKTDKKRRQATLRTSWARELRDRLAAEFAPLQPSSLVLLESEPGCQRQAAHCDYIPSKELLAATEIPLLFLLAIEPNTTLDVWPGSHHIVRGHSLMVCHRETMHLDVGDAIVFRADLVHAGSAYATANRRIHGYLDSAAVPRDPNRTWIIYKHAPTAVQALIDENDVW